MNIYFIGLFKNEVFMNITSYICKTIKRAICFGNHSNYLNFRFDLKVECSMLFDFDYVYIFDFNSKYEPILLLNIINFHDSFLLNLARIDFN